MRPLLLPPCCLLFLVSPAALAQQSLPARAYPPPTLSAPDLRPAPPSHVDVAAAVRRAERRTGGQVLNVESMEFQGREVHRVKVLGPGGRVLILLDDPRGAAPMRPPAMTLPMRPPSPAPARDEP